jgi:hypothetical protein
VEVVCPRCRRELPPDGVNVAKDLAYCAECRQAFSFSQLVTTAESMKIDLGRPPKGAWFERTAEGFVVGSTARSPIAFFLVPFMIVLSGGSLGGIYGSQIATGKFDLLMSLFGIPFLLGSVLFWSIALMAVAGRIVITRRGDELSMFTGVGPVGFTKRVRWSELRDLEDLAKRLAPAVQNKRRRRRREGPTLGDGLTAERQDFVINAVTRMLAERRGVGALELGTLALASSSEGSLSEPRE